MARLNPVRTTSMSAGEVAEGDPLPEVRIDVTTTLIVTGAIASRDFHPLHHDRDRSGELGSHDIIMNIMTTMGLVGRYLTDWGGPEVVIERVSVRLGAPNHPGDCMTLSGTVTDIGLDGNPERIRVGFVGSNSVGDHARGTADLRLPPG